jgi:hypothetical protein
MKNPNGDFHAFKNSQLVDKNIFHVDPFSTWMNVKAKRKQEEEVVSLNLDEGRKEGRKE